MTAEYGSLLAEFHFTDAASMGEVAHPMPNRVLLFYEPNASKRTPSFRLFCVSDHGRDLTPWGELIGVIHDGRLTCWTETHADHLSFSLNLNVGCGAACKLLLSLILSM